MGGGIWCVFEFGDRGGLEDLVLDTCALGFVPGAAA